MWPESEIPVVPLYYQKENQFCCVYGTALSWETRLRSDPDRACKSVEASDSVGIG